MSKKELNQEELEKVTGGYRGDYYGDMGFYGYVDRYAVEVGKTYYFVQDTGAMWGKITVDWTGEVDTWYGSVRTHKGTILDGSKNFRDRYGGYASIESGSYSAYLNLDKSKLPVVMQY